MSATHDYTTLVLPAHNLTLQHTLVGESGGLSAVYNVEPSSAMPGCLAIETEHGYLYAVADAEVVVLAD
jgi:hypothetical protein